MFDNEAKYVAQYTTLSPSPLLLSPVLNFEFYGKITVRLLHIEKNIRRARAFLMNYGESRLAHAENTEKK